MSSWMYLFIAGAFEIVWARRAGPQDAGAL